MTNENVTTDAGSFEADRTWDYVARAAPEGDAHAEAADTELVFDRSIDPLTMISWLGICLLATGGMLAFNVARGVIALF